MRSILFALLIPAALASQGLEPGDKVRTIRTPGTAGLRQEGVVLSARTDSAVVRLATNPGIESTVAVSSLEVSRGQHRQGGRGALVGLIVGGVGGFVVGYAGGDDCGPGDFICFDRRATGLMGAVFFGAIGTGVGAIVGHNTLTDRWVRVGTGR